MMNQTRRLLTVSFGLLMSNGVSIATEVDKYQPTEHHKPHTAMTSKNQLLKESFNFHNFLGKDPYDLQEQYFNFFKEGNLSKAAEYLIASAMCGYGDDQDYLLKLDPQALSYLKDHKVSQVNSLVDKVFKDLEVQYHKRDQKPSKPIILPKDGKDNFVEITKLTQFEK